LPLNIVFSLVAHAAIIITAFTVGRGWTSPAPADLLTVSLVSGLSEIKILDGQDQKKQAIHNPVLPKKAAAVSRLTIIEKLSGTRSLLKQAARSVKSPLPGRTTLRKEIQMSRRGPKLDLQGLCILRACLRLPFQRVIRT